MFKQEDKIIIFFRNTISSILLNQKYKYELTLRLTTYLQNNATEVINKPNFKYSLSFPNLINYSLNQS